MGIVAEVIVAHTRRPLWGYGLMVSAVLAVGVLSMLVWAHHMFLTGMGTTLSAFFQVTTIAVSIPSVVLVTSLVMSLWGGSIRFTTAMLFALAFLPMFGLGGLTGLPLGLAASDVTLHDTYYVVAHFHYLVAPGTMFALFAGIYHWFPAVTGRALSERLGKWHFWLSFWMMNNVFMPMFFVGLAGVNRRMYDAGLQFALAQPYQGLQRHMTISAVALGVSQIPFLIALVQAWRQPAPEPVPMRMSLVQVNHETTPLPAWLLAAWMVMFFGSLLSGYVLLRAGSTTWGASAGSWTLTLGGGAILVAAAVAVRRRTWLGPAAAGGLGAVLVIWLSTIHSRAYESGTARLSSRVRVVVCDQRLPVDGRRGGVGRVHPGVAITLDRLSGVTWDHLELSGTDMARRVVGVLHRVALACPIRAVPEGTQMPRPGFARGRSCSSRCRPRCWCRWRHSRCGSGERSETRPVIERFLPEAASAEAAMLDTVLVDVHWHMLAVFGVWLVILWRRAGEVPGAGWHPPATSRRSTGCCGRRWRSAPGRTR